MKGVSISMLQDPPTALQSSRRNFMRMCAIAASALIAKAKTAAADNFRRDRERDWWRDRDKAKDKDRDWDRRNHQCFLRGTAIRTAGRRQEDRRFGGG